MAKYTRLPHSELVPLSSQSLSCPGWYTWCQSRYAVIAKVRDIQSVAMRVIDNVHLIATDVSMVNKH
jgi:hypothetical protein